MARCPECNVKLVLPEDLELWDHTFCQKCGAELEVVGLEPMELEVVYDDLEEYDLEDEHGDLEDLDADDLEWDEEEGEEESW